MATFQKSVQLIQKTKSNRFDNTHSTWNLLPLRHAPCFVFYTPTNSVSKHRASHMYRANSLTQTPPFNCTEKWSYTENPKFTANRSAYVIESTLVPVLIQLSKAHSYWLQVTDEGIEAINNHQTTLNTLWHHGLKNRQSQLKNM